MKNPTLLIANVTREQALETMNFLYFNRDIYTISNTAIVLWYNKNDEVIAKWTDEYRNVMISKDFVK